MDTQLIFDFLRGVAANNNRQWFAEHKNEYLAAKAEFEQGVAQALGALSAMDASLAHLTVKDCVYRFYRDTRFSPDKSPYKRHFGAYISAHGRKGLHAGYYIHMQPEYCLVAVGAYWLPTNILTSVRNEIMGNIDTWRSCVENGEFIHMFGYPNASKWSDEAPDPKGFGIDCLKTVPKGFPKDYEFLSYLRMKDYCAWHCVPANFFAPKHWTEGLTRIALVAKPMMDFTNNVIDDYE